MAVIQWQWQQLCSDMAAVVLAVLPPYRSSRIGCDTGTILGGQLLYGGSSVAAGLAVIHPGHGGDMVGATVVRLGRQWRRQCDTVIHGSSVVWLCIWRQQDWL
jgi:hypothetical protein